MFSRQHAMKLNKPELTLVKDVDEIVIDEGKRNIFIQFIFL